MADDSEAPNNQGLFHQHPWLAIPLLALSVPVVGIVAGTEAIALQIAIGLIALIVTIGLMARSLMTHRHQLRMSELEAQARLAKVDNEQLEQANRIIEQNAKIIELRSALKAQQEQPAPLRELDS